jgi:hypothetical protein
MHVVLFTPAEQAPAAKARVTPEDDFHLRPRLPQSLHQQFQNRPRMPGGTTIPGPQIGHQQLFATEHVERQETVVAIVTMKVRTFLPAMHAIIGGVKVEDQLGGRRAERGDELVHQNPVQRPGGGAIGAVFQPAQRRTRSQRFDLLDGRLPDWVQPQSVVVVEVFVTVAQAVDALAQQRMLGVFDQRQVARIGQRLRHRLGETQSAIQLAQEWQPAVAGHVAAGKTAGDAPFFYGWKLEQLRVTNCACHSGGLRIHFTPIDIGAQPALRLFGVNFSG